MNAEDERHGSEAGHEQHARDNEDPCAPCYRAKIIAGRRRSKRKAMGHHYTVPTEAARERITEWRRGGATYGEIADHVGIEESRVWEVLNNAHPVIYTRTEQAVLGAQGWPVTTLGLTRRVRALCRMGWSIRKIAEACGVHHDTILDLRRRRPEFVARKVRTGIVAGYEELAMSIPVAESGRDQAGITRARNFAERSEWPAPLAWDDVDDPTERPHTTSPRHVPKHDVDPVVVERVLAGDQLPMTHAERQAVVARGRSRGWSEGEIHARTGIAKATDPARYGVAS